MFFPASSKMLVIPTFLPIIPDIFFILFVPIEAVGLRSRHIISPLRDGKDRNFRLIVK
jgi:hypothetical protein